MQQTMFVNQHNLDQSALIRRRNEIGNCPLCNSNIADRKVSLYKGLINSLHKVFCYLGWKHKHEFEMKEIKHLLGKNEYARFGDLVRFGGIVYKPKDEEGKTRKAYYGMNMARANEFFRGEREIPVCITINQITNEIVSSDYVKVDDFPELKDYLDENGLYTHY
jgi:hypothetical protein